MKGTDERKGRLLFADPPLKGIGGNLVKLDIVNVSPAADVPLLPILSLLTLIYH